MPLDQSVILRNFGRRMRAIRLQQAVTQEELAHRAGLDRSYVGQVERGERNVTLFNIVLLASALDVEPSAFFSVEKIKRGDA